MLGNLIHVTEALDPSAEDLFSSALDLIFLDDTSVLHGDPGSLVTYKSKQFGDIELRLSQPETEEDRRLFAQYLWNAGVLLAELVSANLASRSVIGDGDGGNTILSEMRHDWNVAEEKVLELGAGTGLVGIISVLAGAQEVMISDYPSREILATIEMNCAKNVASRSNGRVGVVGHEWGIFNDDFSKANARRFTKILAADCLWMAGEHQNLVTSMLHFLSDGHENARVWVVAGFHTGRATLASFFEVAHNAGLEVKRIWERDVQGNEREWVKEPQSRPEDITELKKWLVVAILGRK